MKLSAQNTKYQIPNTGFTLVELLVVMAILGVLVTLVAGGFRSAQLRGRDAQRKNDLKQISHAVELFYNDYGKYPDSGAGGTIAGCPTTTGQVCNWGSGEFTDIKTTYFKAVPKDPNSSQNYFYRIVDSPVNKKFQIFARLENTQDPACLGGNCTNPTVPGGVTCGGNCNFAVTSANTTPTE